MIRKAIFSISAAALCAAMLLPIGSLRAAESATAGSDVLAVAKRAGNFQTLVAAIEAAGLSSTLVGEGPFTVFAPTDAAFAKLPAGTVDDLLKPENKDKLVKMLTYHVVAGKALSEDQLKRSRNADTVAGAEVRTSLVRGRLRVNEARVTADVNASNGVIHIIDRVLIPN